MELGNIEDNVVVDKEGVVKYSVMFDENNGVDNGGKESGGIKMSYEFMIGYSIPVIPVIIMTIYFFIVNDLMALMNLMCSLCCWPLIGFLLVSSNNTFVESFRMGARYSTITALIIGGFIWIWFFIFVSGGVTN